MFFAINRRSMRSGEARLRRVAFIGMFFAINRRNMWSGKSRLRRVAFIGIFPAIDRRDMRWILVEIRSPDPKFFFVRVDTLPPRFTPRASPGTRLALHADEIDRKTMAIATAAAPAMV